MSTPQYSRRISLKIGNEDEAVDLSNLRITFKITRGDRQTPNKAEIHVYNLNEQTEKKVKLREFTRVVLQAGYAGNCGVLFDGTVTAVQRTREGAVDTFLNISAADGDSAYNYAVVNRSLAAGSTPADHHQAILQPLAEHGVTVGYTPQLGSNKLPRGKVMFGMVRDTLNTMVRTAAAKWSIQEGKLTIVPLDGFIPGEPLLLSFATGLIDFPARSGEGLTVKMLLNPNARIGQLLEIDDGTDRGVSGLYYLMAADHAGDTRALDWYTTAKCLAVDATRVPADIAKHLQIKAVPGPINNH